MALCRLGHRAAVTLRQPSLGPVFGIKGGGNRWWTCSVWPMEDINLHFTGDAHAVSASHNLLSAFVDNHLFHGNALKLDPHRIRWPRTGCERSGAPRHRAQCGGETAAGQFVITEASEIMAVLALATDHADLRQRLGRIFVGLTESGAMTTAEAFGCVGFDGRTAEGCVAAEPGADLGRHAGIRACRTVR